MRIHANFDGVGTEFEAQVRLTCWPAHTDRATVLLQGKVFFWGENRPETQGGPDDPMRKVPVAFLQLVTLYVFLISA